MNETEEAEFQRLRLAARQRGYRYVRAWGRQGGVRTRLHTFEPLGASGRKINFKSYEEVFDWLAKRGYNPHLGARKQAMPTLDDMNAERNRSHPFHEEGS